MIEINNKIIIRGKLFKVFNFKTLNVLFKKSIFRPEIYDAVKYRGITIFKLKIVRKIKGKNILSPYKKLRLIV